MSSIKLAKMNFFLYSKASMYGSIPLPLCIQSLSLKSVIFIKSFSNLWLRRELALWLNIFHFHTLSAWISIRKLINKKIMKAALIQRLKGHQKLFAKNSLVSIQYSISGTTTQKKTNAFRRHQQLLNLVRVWSTAMLALSN
jgi:hypothetical protein